MVSIYLTFTHENEGFDRPLTDDTAHFLLIRGHLRTQESTLSTPFPVNDFTLTLKLTFHWDQNPRG